MPAPATLTDLISLVVKSELVELSRLQKYMDQLEEIRALPSTPKDLAEALVRDGLLTLFQANLLLRGKWKNFFLAGKYKVLEHIGIGGMGTVFLCEHRHMRRRVAVKLLPPEKSMSRGSLERFQREAQLVAMLDHPNLVRAFDIESEHGVNFIVMEYVDGVNFQHLIDARGPLSVERTVNYIAQAALGLQYASQIGIVHRDIKPSNLMLDWSGTVKLLDLGLARLTTGGDNLTKVMDSKTVLGTADYLAPEQARDSNVDIRADIYSLGAVMHYLITGKPLFDGGNVSQKLIRHQTETAPRLDEICKEVPAELATFHATMLAKSAADRPQNPIELLQGLERWVRDVPPPSPEELPPNRHNSRSLDTKAKLSTLSMVSKSSKSTVMKKAALSSVHA